jgi:hypothetical protein
MVIGRFGEQRNLKWVQTASQLWHNFLRDAPHITVSVVYDLIYVSLKFG